MHHLFSRKALSITLLCIFCTHYDILAQAPVPKSYNRFKKKVDINLPNYDEKILHYGFFLGLSYSRLQITHSDKFVTGNYGNPEWNNKISTITPIGTLGFNLGFLLNVKLFDQFHFKIVPSVGFYDRVLQYAFYNREGKDSLAGSASRQVVETTVIETQLLFKYRSLRRVNHRFYLVGGIRPGIRVGGRRGDDNSNKLSLTRNDLCIEYGAGIDLYFQFFKFSPELRFSHGIVNMVAGDKNIYNESLLSAYSHTVSLLFFFE